MNKEILNSLKPGEKTVDVFEYYWGRNGEKLVYKVIVYTCKKILWFKYISKFEFPFYFENKNIVNDFLANIDKFKIDTLVKHDMWGDSAGLYYILIPNNIKNVHYIYRMRGNYEYLFHGDIWTGYIDCLDISSNKDTIYINKYFTEIEKIELNVTKEGTIGNKISYKLQPLEQ